MSADLATESLSAPENGSSAQRGPRSRRRRPLAMLCLVAVIGLMASTVITFQLGTRSSSVSGDAGLRDGIRVHANVFQVKPEEDHMIVRVSFEPLGSLSQGDRYLAQPVRIIADGGADVVDETYNAGAVMPPKDLQVALGDGDINEYPFDSYDALFQVRVVTDNGNAVPSVLFGQGSVHGYRLKMTDPVPEPNSGNNMTVDVARAPATLLFALFVMLLMWALTIFALTMASREIRGGGPIDGTLISLLGVLLFAFPAVRNSVPNAPAIGVLGDFLSYFWCEVALGLGLVTLLATRIRRERSASTGSGHSEDPGIA